LTSTSYSNTDFIGKSGVGDADFFRLLAMCLSEKLFSEIVQW